MSTFGHSGDIWSKFPGLGAVALTGRLRADFEGAHEDRVRLTGDAQQRLTGAAESEFPEIQAWRAAFGSMGLKPTKYRCAAEALLRRLRIQGDMPQVNPLVDYYNAVSVAAAVPIAVFDLDKVSGSLLVDFSAGDETYLAFSGETETPEPGEVIFRDDARNVHARRWCHRQSALSAAGESTRRVLIVAESMHEESGPTLDLVVRELTAATGPLESGSVRTQRLTRDDTTFDFG
ncbi:B3/4 domain-containing protein [Nocardia sp. NPDC052566]|uniref:B3/4 domain-containing protein n=1 Tax=Nocardia sp. NPDC052566 TaxID=3364330 RepID=UPI0037C6CADC